MTAKKMIIYLTIFFFFLILFQNCKRQNDTTPKPRGYFRIDLPKKKYEKLEINCPYKFQYPAYTKIVKDPGGIGKDCWINIHYTQFDGDIHISYKQINNNLKTYVEDARNLAYKHTIKAEAIREKLYEDTQRDVYGILYELKGNVASPAQFFVTDSSRHFLRGSLYFRTEPNKDSLAPVTKFVKKDIEHLIETLHWKN
jgi:gliding motility-associated lipoprotein GldD